MLGTWQIIVRFNTMFDTIDKMCLFQYHALVQLTKLFVFNIVSSEINKIDFLSIMLGTKLSVCTFCMCKQAFSVYA